MRSVVRLISAGVLSAFAIGTVSAADLPRRAPPPPPPVVVAPYTWTGCHVGIHGGFAYDDYHFATHLVSPTGDSFSGRSKVYTSGPLGGGDIGCDYRLPWNIVVGVAADADAAAIHGSISATGPLAGAVGGIGGLTTTTRVNALGTLRIRVGYAFDHFLFTYNVLISSHRRAAYGSIRDTFFHRLCRTRHSAPGRACATRSASGRTRRSRHRHREDDHAEPLARCSVPLSIYGRGDPLVPLFPAGQARFGTRST